MINLIVELKFVSSNWNYRDNVKERMEGPILIAAALCHEVNAPNV